MNKLVKRLIAGFAVTALSVVAVGFAQNKVSAGQPGQVGDAPRCTVESVGPRGKAFTVNGTKASVDFKVSGPNNCKVKVSTMAFYAPSMTGKPYNQQTLFDKHTRTFDKPGRYTMNVSLPERSIEKKGCFYQVDLTYGDRIHSPVLAYGHGRLECGKPTAKCENLKITKLDRTKFRFNAKASTKHGAEIKGYTFTVSKNGNKISEKTTRDNSMVYTQTAAGTYKVRVTVKTSVGPQTSNDCVGTFTVNSQAQGDVDIDKLVDGVDHKFVVVGAKFNYQLKVTNTGARNLTNVVVRDTAPAHVSFLSTNTGTITGDQWTHTIPSLAKGESKVFTITAKVNEYVAGDIVNTACVDAPEVPGNPDDCDDATVKVSKPGHVFVCDPATGQVIEVPEAQADTYLPVDSPQCKPVVPAELPNTGVGSILGIFTAVSFVGAFAHRFVLSRLSLFS
jgi:uncharacterized repeat protein (TIGR01451 family)